MSKFLATKTNILYLIPNSLLILWSQTNNRLLEAKYLYSSLTTILLDKGGELSYGKYNR